MKKIELSGILAKKFGKYFELDVSTPKEACDALSYQIKGFRQFMQTAHEDGLFFAVFNDDNNIGKDELEHQTGASVIRIVPKIVGSGGDSLGFLQVIAGAVMVGVGVFTGNFALIGAGAGLLIGGAATLLMPTPDMSVDESDGNKASYAYSGAVTTTKAGNPVPVGFGRTLVGGHWLGAMSVSEDT